MPKDDIMTDALKHVVDPALMNRVPPGQLDEGMRALNGLLAKQHEQPVTRSR